MGVKVTIIEALDRILNAEDAEISALAHKSFEKRGIAIHTSAQLGAIEKTKNSVMASVMLKGKQEVISAEQLIMAVGIVGNSEGLGLEATKVKLDRGHIVTNQVMATDEPGLYAIGALPAHLGLPIRPAMRAFYALRLSRVRKTCIL